jgi:aspartokinase
MNKKPVTDITVTYNVALITVDNLPGDMRLISQILGTVAAQDVNIDMISQSPFFRGIMNFSFTIPSEDIAKVIGVLNKFKNMVPGLVIEVDSDNTKLTVYGEHMKFLPGVAARIFAVIAEKGIEIKLITTSESEISFLLYEKDIDSTSDAIRTEFGMNT